MLTHPKTSTEWGTYSFSHAPTTKSGTCPCTPLQALRLSKKWLDGPLQNEEPATNLARGFLYKIKAPNPIFLVHFRDFQNRWPPTEWLDLWQVPDSVEVRQNHFFGQPKCLQGCARTGSWFCSGSMAETVGSSFCRGFSVSENHKSAPKKRIGRPYFVGEPDVSKHLSRIATRKKENHQKYKDPFCRGMMWKNLGPPVSPENPEMYKKIFCRGNSCSTFPVFVKSIYIYIIFVNIYAHECWHTPKPLQNEEPTVSAM